jgi:glutaredoxin
MLSVGAAQGEQHPATAPRAVPVYLFLSPTCPHCAKAKAFLETLAAQEPPIEVRAFEVGKDELHDRAFVALNERFKIEPPAVPLIAIGDKIFVGFDTAATTGAELRAAIAGCRRERCPDVAGSIIRSEASAIASERREQRAKAVRRPALPETIRLPLLGDIKTRSLSLPALTVVLGLVDGFNPCAMWVLVFLIGLLIGMKDPVRMWSYGTVFLLTSAAVYLAFMAAWLNILMFLGSLTFIRAGIGLFAISAGGYYLWQFWSNPDAACPVTSPDERQRVMTRLKEAVAQRSFLAAVAGIVILAALVNLIELLCSAGIPAVYTQVLAMSDLSSAAYIGYLLLYITLFLIDDMIVFATAILTLRATGLAATYSRYSHLLGGIVLAGIGLLLLFRPEWLVLA